MVVIKNTIQYHHLDYFSLVVSAPQAPIQHCRLLLFAPLHIPLLAFARVTRRRTTLFCVLVSYRLQTLYTIFASEYFARGFSTQHSVDIAVTADQVRTLLPKQRCHMRQVRRWLRISKCQRGLRKTFENSLDFPKAHATTNFKTRSRLHLSDVSSLYACGTNQIASEPLLLHFSILDSFKQS